ncbi:hypothetical protein [Pseudomonas amygdali]|uniref:hypothetical protein n=1 Tax=Pseudomonas amygdali TaxID=47877 RepID=UPI0006E5C76C|nr:hypothetical protein [Pseudomonas amygdali]KPY55709.1 hypothetical protein ALO93_200204 [Pseudomonas amygdali pv. sesami]
MKVLMALFAGLVTSVAVASPAQQATTGIPMVLVGEQKHVESGDVLTFKEVGAGQCSYSAVVESGVLAVIDKKICPDGLTTKVSLSVPLAHGLAANGWEPFMAYEHGPVPLAVTFMTQFYDVPSKSVKVEIIKQTSIGATVKAEAEGHVCTFDAAPLPTSTSKVGWAVSSTSCAATK